MDERLENAESKWKEIKFSKKKNKLQAAIEGIGKFAKGVSKELKQPGQAKWGGLTGPSVLGKSVFIGQSQKHNYQSMYNNKLSYGTSSRLFKPKRLIK